jgi:hypothetical protein
MSQQRRADRVREAQVAVHVAVTSRVVESGRGSRQSRRRCGATGSGVTLRLRGTVPTWHRLMAVTVAVFTPADATVSACPRVLQLRYGASATAPPRRRPLRRRLPVPSERSWLTSAPSIRERLRDAARVERLALNYSSILGPLSNTRTGTGGREPLGMSAALACAARTVHAPYGSCAARISDVRACRRAACSMRAMSRVVCRVSYVAC